MEMKKIVISIMEMVTVVVITVFIFSYCVIPIRINGISMQNTLENNDIAIVNAISVNEENINRFDVVVLKSAELNEKIIKRVIGLPGDHIEFKDDILYVNGQRLEQDFLDLQFVEKSKEMYNAEKFTDDFEVEVNEGEYFVMGDNRLRSTDSRQLGCFKINDFIGVQGVVIYPFSHIQWF